MLSNGNFHVEPCQEADMVRCAEIMSEAFAGESIGPLMFGPHEPASWAKTAAAHWTAVQEHAERFPSVPFAIKCVYRDPGAAAAAPGGNGGGAETIVGTAEWTVWDRERTPAEWVVEPYTNRLEYISDDGARSRCREAMAPMIGARQRLVQGRRYGLLTFMAVDPRWRRMGAATACVRWGMERCRELGVPGYLEATEEGMKAYRKMGWEEVVMMEGEGEGLMYPPMMWWPEGVERWVKTA